MLVASGCNNAPRFLNERLRPIGREAPGCDASGKHRAGENVDRGLEVEISANLPVRDTAFEDGSLAAATSSSLHRAPTLTERTNARTLVKAGFIAG